MNKPKKFYALSVMGSDRIGIISKITEVLYRRKINIADSSMTRLRREFAMILLLEATEEISDGLVAELQARLSGISFYLRRLKPDEEKKPPKPTKIFTVTLYGRDRTGLVHQLSNILARQKINIINLRTSILETRPPTYLMFLDAEPPKNYPFKRLQKLLSGLSRRLKITINLGETEPVDL